MAVLIIYVASPYKWDIEINDKHVSITTVFCHSSVTNIYQGQYQSHKTMLIIIILRMLKVIFKISVR